MRGHCCLADLFEGGPVAPTTTTQSSSLKIAPRHANLVLMPQPNYDAGICTGYTLHFCLSVCLFVRMYSMMLV